jgi:hypothetical protein
VEDCFGSVGLPWFEVSEGMVYSLRCPVKDLCMVITVYYCAIKESCCSYSRHSGSCITIFRCIFVD